MTLNYSKTHGAICCQILQKMISTMFQLRWWSVTWFYNIFNNLMSHSTFFSNTSNALSFSVWRRLTHAKSWHFSSIFWLLHGTSGERQKLDRRDRASAIGHLWTGIEVTEKYEKYDGRSRQKKILYHWCRC